MALHPATAPIRVLLVDDNPGDVRLIAAMLQQGGGGLFHLEHVDRLDRAIERVRGREVDVILLDLGLPDSQGLQTFQRAYDETSGEPIVVISGQDDRRVALEAVRAGAQDYLVKGRFEWEALDRVLRYALERKHAEEAMAKRERQFKALVENSWEAIAVLDRDMKILYCSPAVTRILGFAPEERVGRSALDLVDSDKRSSMKATFEESLKRPGEQIPLRAALRHSDGSWRLVEGVFTNLLDDPDVHGVVTNYRDVTDREQAAEWIRRLSMAVDQSPASVLITDLSGTIEYTNARFTEASGYAAEEVLGRKPSIMKSGETPREKYQDLWRTIRAGERWHGEVRNRKKDGTLYWDAVWISPIRDAEGRVTHFLALQEDVTERRAMVEALKDREERFRQVTEAIHEVYFLADAGFTEMLYVSPAYEEVWGRTCQSLYDTPRSFMDAVLPEDVPGLLESIETSRREGVAGRSEYRIRRPDGEIRWIQAHQGGVTDDKGEVYRLAGVALDVTVRKNAEEALRTSELRLRTLLETVNLIVLALDADGRVEYVNPFLASLTGYGRDEMLAREWMEFVPEAQRPQMTEAFRELLEHELHPHKTNPILTKAGEERMISWHNTVLRDALGRPIGTLSIGEDITEQAHLEAQLRQAQKMEAVGRLAGGIAHDFNNLLTVILSTTELLRLDMAPTEQQSADLEEIRSATERAAGLTHQLLAFSRQQVLEPRIVDLNALVANVDRLLARVIGEDIRLRTLPGADLGSVRADPGQLEQVILNLAINARDAMPKGGMLTIETANVELDEAYAAEHTAVQPGQYVMLAVSDSGTGMDSATRAQIFDPFFTTKPKGTGLGLSTVYGIVKQSGGFIWVYSEPGQGTTFRLYLPRVDGPAQSLAEPRPTRESLAGTETILVVEDEEVVRTLTQRVLESHGYAVHAFGSGREALEMVEGLAGPLDLLVTDVVMPDMNGRELAGRLAKSRPDAAVLYVSGYTNEAIVQHGVLVRGVYFLQKPFAPDALARKVRQVLDAAK
jgi:PAS domain S-box-containing protein